jgi:type IV pilus assembly protein PilB
MNNEVNSTTGFYNEVQNNNSNYNQPNTNYNMNNNTFFNNDNTFFNSNDITNLENQAYQNTSNINYETYLEEINSKMNTASQTNQYQENVVPTAVQNSIDPNQGTNNSLTFNDYNDTFNNLINIDFENTPIVDAANEILLIASQKGASDIHLDPATDCLKVRFRIDGILETYLKVPNVYKQNLITRIKIMSGMNITETRLPQDGAIKTNLGGMNLDMRVSALPTKKGEKVVIRILDYSRSVKGIEYLYFSQLNYAKVLKMLAVPNGIILVTGATGSGKSTTVYSFLQRLNTEGTNLITVEDPVEMEIEGINQVQVNSEIGLNFATVLRSILRQDPNIIMIGEIRDSETAQIAVRASITGHLVLSTIHTNNSLNTIERLLDMNVERYLLASSLEGIVSQKLARKLCDNCKKVRPTTQFEKNIFHNFIGMDINEVYEPVGCPECSHGYKGRIAIQEVLIINQEIRDAISKGMRKEELRRLVYTKDVISMFQDGLYKAISGYTTISEILKLIELDDEISDDKELTELISTNNTH